MCFIEVGSKLQVGCALQGTDWFVFLLFVYNLVGPYCFALVPMLPQTALKMEDVSQIISSANHLILCYFHLELK